MVRRLGNVVFVGVLVDLVCEKDLRDRLHFRRSRLLVEMY